MTRMVETLSVRVTAERRAQIETLAKTGGVSMAVAARGLLEAGLEKLDVIG